MRSQYTLFSESRRLSDKSIVQFFECGGCASTNSATRCCAAIRRALAGAAGAVADSGARAAPSRRSRRRSVFWHFRRGSRRCTSDRELFDAVRNGVKAAAGAPPARRGRPAGRRNVCSICWPEPPIRRRGSARGDGAGGGANPGVAAPVLARHALPAGRPAGQGRR